jgi:hypothetical protein
MLCGVGRPRRIWEVLAACMRMDLCSVRCTVRRCESRRGQTASKEKKQWMKQLILRMLAAHRGAFVPRARR